MSDCDWGCFSDRQFSYPLLCGLLLEVSVKLFLAGLKLGMFHVEQDDKLLVDGSRFQLYKPAMSTIMFSLMALPTSSYCSGVKEALQRGVFGHHHLLLHTLHEGGVAISLILASRRLGWFQLMACSMAAMLSFILSGDGDKYRKYGWFL